MLVTSPQNDSATTSNSSKDAWQTTSASFQDYLDRIEDFYLTPPPIPPETSEDNPRIIFTFFWPIEIFNHETFEIFNCILVQMTRGPPRESIIRNG